MFYLTLMKDIFVNAHPHLSNRKSASHFAPYFVNQLIVNTNSHTG